MNLELTTEQAQELRTLLEQALGELSHEIAATDNAGYRAELADRRRRLTEVTETLGNVLAIDAAIHGPEALVRTLAEHPGD